MLGELEFDAVTLMTDAGQKLSGLGKLPPELANFIHADGLASPGVLAAS